MVQILGKDVGTTGYGLMGLTWRAKPPSEEQAFEAMRASLKHGCLFWNGGEFYGPKDYNSLILLNRYFTKYPEDADKIILSIKGGVNLETMSPDGSSEGIKRSVDNCLKLLGGKKNIDIFECARVDKNTEIEVTMKALQEYVDKGLIGGIAMSEVGAKTLERAAKVVKIVAAEVEFSLFSLDILSNGVAKVCAKYDIPIVAYSPIGRGMLTGEIRKPEDIPEDDIRKHLPRFRPENFPKNLELVKDVQTLAKQKGCTPAQLALNWVKAQSGKDGNPVIIPIPGATTAGRVEENAKDVSLTKEDLAQIDEVLKSFGGTAGDRYWESAMEHIEG